jgi:hypothetical protein
VRRDKAAGGITPVIQGVAANAKSHRAPQAAPAVALLHQRQAIYAAQHCDIELVTSCAYLASLPAQGLIRSPIQWRRISTSCLSQRTTSMTKLMNYADNAGLAILVLMLASLPAATLGFLATSV